MSLALVPEPGRPTMIARHAPGSPEWLKQRARRVGGSEIADVIGLGFSSRYRLYWEKAIGLPRWSDGATDELLYWGTASEPIIMDRYVSDLADDDHRSVLRWPGVFVHPDHPWMLASPDGIELWDGGWDTLIEIKSVSSQAGGWSASEYPPKYRAQMLWNCYVLGLRKARLVVKIDSAGYRVYPLLDLDHDEDADEDLTFMIERGRRFLDDIEARNDPRPDDGSEATWEAARRVHPDVDKGARAEIDSDLAADYMLAVIEAEQAARELTRQKSLVIEQMGTAQHAHAIKDGEVDELRFAYRTWKTQRDGSPGAPYLAPDARVKKALGPKTIKAARDAEA